MNAVIHNIASRRTVKPAAMSGAKIDDQLVWQCLEAGHWAPNHARTEPWRFIVYTQDTLVQFCKDHAALYQQSVSEDNFNPTKFQSLLHQADTLSHAVMIVMKRTPEAKIPWLEEYAATAAAAQNILLAATSLNIATIWSTGGMILTDAMKAYLQLEAEDAVLGCIFMGEAKEEVKAGTRKVTVAEKTDWKK